MNEPLSDGHPVPVVRVGDTVRRWPGPTTQAAHALLRHIRNAGFREAPLPMGFDAEGREVLTFVEGEVWAGPYPQVVWLDQTLVDAASLLRRFHDATLGFRVPAEVAWQVESPSDLPVEIICHNDFAPYNAVFLDRRLAGIIDFDAISPGARVWDLAHAAYRFVPLARHAVSGHLSSSGEQARRLRLFCDAYDASRSDRDVLVDVVVRRVAALRDRVVSLAAEGDPAGLRHLADGDADEYANDLAHILSARAAFEHGL